MVYSLMSIGVYIASIIAIVALGIMGIRLLVLAYDLTHGSDKRKEK